MTHLEPTNLETMPEPFSVITGSVGLVATTFKSCIDIFNHIHLSRRFGTDYQTAQLRLAVVQCQLSRWGAAVHINDEPPLSDLPVNEEELDTAASLLGQIHNLIKETSNLKDSKILDDNDRSHASDESLSMLTARMASTAMKRQKHTSVLKLTTWSIHSRGVLKELIGDIEKLMDGLLKLFPVEEVMTTLAQEEVADLSLQEARKLLAAAKDLDPMLQEALSGMTGHRFTNIEIDGGIDASVGQGNHVAADYSGQFITGSSHTYNGVKIKGQQGLRILQGDTYGGEGFFSKKASSAQNGQVPWGYSGQLVTRPPQSTSEDQ